MITEERYKAWIEALESGEYKRNTGYLHNSLDNTFCCLGVYHDLFLDGPCPRRTFDAYIDDEEIPYIVQERLANWNDYLPKESSSNFRHVLRFLKKKTLQDLLSMAQ